MSHDEQFEHLSGQLQQLLFSPKGGIEGVMLRVDSRIVQVSMRHDEADARTLQQAIGKVVELRVSADRSPKARGGTHAVYKLRAISTFSCKSVPSKQGTHAISGVVSSIHYAKHGEPNGVVLKSGEFIHARPRGMKKLKLGLGAKVTAEGELRMTILGMPLMEAHQVNRVTLE
jgi:hypothetical protein